ncbi:transposable element Tcb2 transposase [Trichonephila clavipes]|uniref:Transposable element Tcb2 transposase n=1 Tax=Trichonephila clavipes TaxID=2585209 RepID=A0A8X6RZ14_TRICX|nr:transposable element Tcb2 transposase [Trichonephila clavipes]
MWNVTDWQNFMFSDESRFVLGTHDNRVRVWRRPGERYNSPHTVLRHTARTAGVMVWGVIAYDSRSTLIVMRRTLTGQRYVDDILRPHVGPFLNGLPGAIFSKIMLVRIQQELLKTSYVIFRLFHGRPAPSICTLQSTVGPAKTADAIVSLCTWFSVGFSRFEGPSASGQHKMSNQLNAGPCGGMYCSWRWSNALLKLPSICVVVHPVFV